MATVSFASFNLYNFQIEGGKTYHGKIVKKQDYLDKLAWTSHMLTKVNADIYAFQELWSWKCLEAAFKDANLFNDYNLVYLSGGADPKWRGIAVAMAIRKGWAINSKAIIKDFPFQSIVKIDEGDDEDDEIDLKIKRFSRSIINLELEKDTKKINVYAVHLKAKLPSTVKTIASEHKKAIGGAISTIRRTAEAAALRWFLTDSMKNTNMPTVVMGDFNDDPRSNTLAIITEQPSMTISSTGGDTSLYSTLQLQQLQSFRDVLYTHDYNRLKDTLDHVLVSKEFFQHATNAIWKHEDTRIWNDYIEDDEDASSDHGIIKSSFKT